MTKSPGLGIYLVCKGLTEIVFPFLLIFPCFVDMTLSPTTKTPCPASIPSDDPRSSPGTTTRVRCVSRGPSALLSILMLSSCPTGLLFITVDVDTYGGKSVKLLDFGLRSPTRDLANQLVLHASRNLNDTCPCPISEPFLANY